MLRTISQGTDHIGHGQECLVDSVIDAHGGIHGDEATMVSVNALRKAKNPRPSGRGILADLREPYLQLWLGRTLQGSIVRSMFGLLADALAES